MDERLIVALDYPDDDRAMALVRQLGDRVGYYKVGLELFLNTQGRILSALKDADKKIFLDLKFHDIPNTVAKACYWAAGLGVDMFNVHASGGAEMMRRAKESAAEGAAQAGLAEPVLLGVTILTSLDDHAITEIGFEGKGLDNVRRLARLAYDAGLNGVVCSPQEIAAVQEATDPFFVTVCPGIRPAGAAVGDQKRIMTPGEAVAKGVGYIVVGRPITQAADPAQAVETILTEMQA